MSKQLLTIALLFSAVSVFAEDKFYPSGADAVFDISSPRFLGDGAFVTKDGSAEEMAVNPASGGEAQRMVFDAGFSLITGGDEGNGAVVNAGALFPTRFAVFGVSGKLIVSPTYAVLSETTAFAVNGAVSKELYPGMSFGAGFNFGAGTKGTNTKDFFNLSGDIGFRYNIGNVGPTENFTIGFTARALGLSTAPTPFTFVGGVKTDVLHIKSRVAEKKDPLVLTALGDAALSVSPNFFAKLGVNALFFDIVTLSVTWGINGREAKETDSRKTSFLPTVGLGGKFTLQSTGKRIAGGKLPTDGDISVNLGLKPLYKDYVAAGAGATWTVGVRDKKPPVIKVDYPESVYISPNHDGVQDALEFPVRITDERYVTGWSMEIYDEAGALVRTYRNKETRVETLSFSEIVKRIREVKGGVLIPENFRWDGFFEDGGTAPDGKYTFVIKAHDDNDNEAATPPYTVFVDNTPPSVALSRPITDMVFSPDGDGNKDTFTIPLTCSEEDSWQAYFYNSEGEMVEERELKGAPTEIVWDGRIYDGSFAPDGVYRFSIGALDRAGNSGSFHLPNIVISTIKPSTALSISDAYFSPNGDGIKDTLRLLFDVPVKEGITTWKLEIEDEAGNKKLERGGAAPVPLNFEFDGKGANGAALAEGAYKGRLSVAYRNGYVSQSASPTFYLDVTAPSASVKASLAAFSPNNDGDKDDMPITQSGSNEVLWTGVVKNADNPNAAAVKTVRFYGNPSASFVWDGYTDSGALAENGSYIYELSATDRAGNSGKASTDTFILSTAGTKLGLSTNYRAFSPNGDRVRDTINFTPQIETRDGITSWRLNVRDDKGAVVKAFNGTTQVPASIAWDGKRDNGSAAADGSYTAKIELTYIQGGAPTAETLPFILDTVAPDGSVNPAYTLFSPNGDGKRDTLPLGVATKGSDTWEALITDAAGKTVRRWTWQGASPAIEWDGKDEAGNQAADGAYKFALSSTDEAGNSTKAEVAGIRLDARTPNVYFTQSAQAIAPAAGKSIVFAPFLSFTDGIATWELSLRDSKGGVVKSFSNTTNGAAPPKELAWDGKNNAGSVQEGSFTPVLTVNWTKGDEARVGGSPIIVDVSGPALEFVTSPEYFSPDNDGVDDELFISLGMEDASPIASWSIVVREPQTGRVFHRFEGKDHPAGRLVWDGRGNARGGELVQAASDYPYTYTAEDALGNVSKMEGVIGIDVLVIRDGDNLKIAVPSIQFRKDAWDFNGLATDVVATNNRVLTRIAQILNKFRDYKVVVEGHANPTTQVGAARDKEESGELVPLSESRARAIVDILTKNGVAKARLSSVGMGGKRTVADWDDKDNNWKNRRVEFILIK